MKTLEIFAGRSREAQQLEVKLFHKGAHNFDIQVAVLYNPNNYSQWYILRRYKKGFHYTVACYEDSKCIQPATRIKRKQWEEVCTSNKLVRFRVNEGKEYFLNSEM